MVVGLLEQNLCFYHMAQFVLCHQQQDNRILNISLDSSHLGAVSDLLKAKNIYSGLNVSMITE